MRSFQRPDKPRLLVVTNLLPGDHFAGDQRLVRLCQLLLRRFEVHVVATMVLTEEQAKARAERLERIGVVVEAASRTPVRDALIRHPFDGVLVEFWHVAADAIPTIRRWQPWARIVVDSVDLEFVRDERGVGHAHGRAPDVVSRRKEQELAAYGHADALMFVSVDEQEIYRRLRNAPSTSWVIPILVALGTRTVRRRQPIVLFVGNFAHLPNLDGIAWFAREVWPQVRGAVPGATLRIVGANQGPEITELGHLDGVAVVGLVEDLDTEYDDAAVAVAPLRWGAGMKGKVCEALANAVPLVTTAIGAEGLRMRSGVDLVVADRESEMARAVVALLDDAAAAEDLGARGQAAIATQCLPEAVLPVVDELADFVTDHGQRRPPRSWWLRIAAGCSVSSSRRVAARMYGSAASGSRSTDGARS